VVSDPSGNEPAWDHVLRHKGLIVLLEGPATGALSRWSANAFDVVVVDAGETASRRIRLGQTIREHIDASILLCLHPSQEKSILKAYAAGMQEVVLHPLDPPILLAKILAWARHQRNGLSAQGGPFNTGKYSLNPSRRCLIDAHGMEIMLTSLEFRLLQLLMSRPGHVFSVEEIVRSIWGVYGQNDHVLLKNVVYRLRRKIGADPRRPRLVHTWPGGYSFQV